jgi:hypothetical protein
MWGLLPASILAALPHVYASGPNEDEAQALYTQQATT